MVIVDDIMRRVALQEREKLKEEKKKYAERLKLWSKPREDMECEDLRVSERTTAPSDLPMAPNPGPKF